MYLCETLITKVRALSVYSCGVEIGHLLACRENDRCKPGHTGGVVGMPWEMNRPRRKKGVVLASWSAYRPAERASELLIREALRPTSRTILYLCAPRQFGKRTKSGVCWPSANARDLIVSLNRRYLSSVKKKRGGPSRKGFERWVSYLCASRTTNRMLCT